MKKRIMELLTTKFEGVDSKILEGIASKLAETTKTDEEATTAVEGVTFSQVLKSYGDSRANQASVSAVSNYEKKYKLKDGKAIDLQGDVHRDVDDDNADNVPEYVKKIMDVNNALLSKIENLQGEVSGLKTQKLTESRSAKLQKIISELSEAQKRPYARITLDKMSDEEFESFIDEVKSDVSSIEKDNAALKANVGKPMFGNIHSDKKATDSELEEVVGRILPRHE